jgi:outer membrane protein OmpA-like peptidoglycan-associated protein
LYAAEGSGLPQPPPSDPADVELARRPGCIGLGPWAWFLLLPLLILLLLLLLALAMGMALPWATAAGGSLAGVPFLPLLALMLLIGLVLLLAGLRGFSRAIGEAVGEWILPAAFGGLLLLLLLSFLKRCLLAAGFWPLMLLPIFTAIAARRPQAVLGSVVMAALALFANPRGPNNECFDNDVVETRQRVEQQVERRMNPDRNANVVAIATRDSEGGERMTLDQALADPDRFFTDCGQPIYVSSELLFNVNEAEISERAPPQLEKLAALMDLRPGTRVRLEGYTDATGPADLNRRLSEQRAQAIADWLVGNTTVGSDSVETVGRGDAAPIVSDPNLYYLNRRVEISVI